MIRLRIPNPFVEGRNCVYVIKSDPVTMIDTGVATRRAFDALQQGLQEHGLTLRDIKRVILTHKHIDHIGNAWRIQQQSGAEILIHESEVKSVTNVDPAGGRFADLVKQRLQDWNVPSEALPSESSSKGPTWELESAEATGICHGQQIPFSDAAMEVIHTPGHTMGSCCLHYGGHLFSGDHVLPEISPNVGGGDMRNRGLLRHYLESLTRIVQAANGDSVQVMPGHGDPFDDLAGRCAELVAHHFERLDQAVDILRKHGPQTVYDVARRLFGKMADFHVVLGCAEAGAHLEYLEDEGRVVHDNGTYRLA